MKKLESLLYIIFYSSYKLYNILGLLVFFYLIEYVEPLGTGSCEIPVRNEKRLPRISVGVGPLCLMRILQYPTSDVLCHRLDPQILLKMVQINY